MKPKHFLLVVFTLFIVHISYSQQQQSKGKLIVEIGEFRNTNGHLLLSLFNTSEGFPEDKKGAYRIKKIKVSQSKEEIVFEDLPYGEYAIIFLHDENDNNDMNTNMMGIPQEGYGASNNAVNTFSAPKYKEAKFEVFKPTNEQTLKIYY